VYCFTCLWRSRYMVPNVVNPGNLGARRLAGCWFTVVRRIQFPVKTARVVHNTCQELSSWLWGSQMCHFRCSSLPCGCVTDSLADPGVSKGGPYGECGAWANNRGLVALPPVGSRGKALVRSWRHFGSIFVSYFWYHSRNYVAFVNEQQYGYYMQSASGG